MGTLIHQQLVFNDVEFSLEVFEDRAVLKFVEFHLAD